MVDLQNVAELMEERKYTQLGEFFLSSPVAELDEEAFGALAQSLSRVPDEERRQSASLCFLSMSCDVRKGRIASARSWFGQLAVLRDSRKEGSGERALLAQLTCCGGIMMPQTDNAQLLLLLSILHNETTSHRLEPVRLSPTYRRPSVLRGAKDLSEWGKNYRAVISIAGPLTESISPGNSAAICAAAVAELLYEKNDLNAAAIEVAAALSSGCTEIVFAGYAQLARIARLDTTGQRPEELLGTLGRLLEENNATHLLDNYRALCASFYIHAGQLDKVQSWMDSCKVSGFGDRVMANGYELLVRAQALIAFGRHREAVTLLESILLMLREDFRPLDTAECLVLSAIACELLGSRELALDRLEEALRIAAPYRYIRVIADGGKVAFHLMSQLLKDTARTRDLPERYLQSVSDAAMTYSMLFPRLFASDSYSAESEEAAVELTSTELQILQLMSDGKSNKQIGEALSVQVSTVKFHATNIYEKLGAPNRVGAINAAKKMNIL